MAGASLAHISHTQVYDLKMRKGGLNLSLKQELVVLYALYRESVSFIHAYHELSKVETEELSSAFRVVKSRWGWGFVMPILYKNIIEQETNPLMERSLLGEAFPKWYVSEYSETKDERHKEDLVRRYLLSREPYIRASIDYLEEKIELQEAQRQYSRAGPPPLEKLLDGGWMVLDGSMRIPVFLRDCVHGGKLREFIQRFFLLSKELQVFIMKESLLGLEYPFKRNDVYQLYKVVKDLLFLHRTHYGDPEERQPEEAVGRQGAGEPYPHVERIESILDYENAKVRQHIVAGLTQEEKDRFWVPGSEFLSGAKVVRGIDKDGGLPHRPYRGIIRTTGPRGSSRISFPQTVVTAEYQVAEANRGMKLEKKGHGAQYPTRIRNRQKERLARLVKRPGWMEGGRISQRTNPVTNF